MRAPAHTDSPRRDPPMRVLLVEDSEAEAFLTRRSLGHAVEVQHVSTLAHGIEALGVGAFDAIVADLSLPDSRGVDTVVALRAASTAPILVLTGATLASNLCEAAIEAGADDFYLKGATNALPLHHALSVAQARRCDRSNLRTLIRDNADAMVVTDRDGLVTFLNPAAEALFDRSSEAMVGSRFDWPMEAEEQIEIELRSVKGPRTVEMRSASISWNGRPAWLATLRDVTDRRRAVDFERRLLHADRLATIGRLAAGVAHEINTPAAFVSTNLEVIHQKVAAANATEWSETVTIVDDCLEGMRRISAIVRELSSFARIEEDALHEIDLNEVVDAACNMAANRIRHCARLVKQKQPVPTIVGERGKLVQVLVNLLVNAADAILAGGGDDNRITVTTAQRDGMVVVTVADTGCGIDEAGLARIYDPFYTTKPRDVGTGLGLAICLETLRKHGGALHATSSLGEGARFEMCLPVGSQAIDVAPAAEKTAAPPPLTTRRSAVRLASTADPSPPPAPLDSEARILFVEDDRMLRRAMRRALSSYDVVEAANGLEALEVVDADEDFDLVVCDLMMPEMNGSEFFEALRDRGSRLSERIVFVTGGVFVPEVEAFLERERPLVLEKPLSKATMRGLIRRFTEAAPVAERGEEESAP